MLQFYPSKTYPNLCLLRKLPIQKRIRCCLQTKRKVFSHQNSKKAEISSIHTFQSHFLSCFLRHLTCQEHQLPFLFPFKDLDLGSLATGYALLRLPRLKEILGKQVKGFQQSEVGVEWCSSCFPTSPGRCGKSMNRFFWGLDDL